MPLKPLLILLLLPTTLLAQPFPLADAKEFSPRDGLPNFLSRLQSNRPVRIAYIGGSITAQEGYRPKTTTWIREQAPGSQVTEINASIGGTGSDLGVFRFRDDVLIHHPHLIFYEFAVNDAGADPIQIIRCMEGMVRQAWAQDPSIDLCFVYTVTDNQIPTLQQGKFQRSASAMEKVADHYGIPAIHLGLEVAKLAKEGKLILKADPKTAQEKEALKDKIIFSPDGVHPHPDTGHKLYFQAIQRSLSALKGVGQVGPHALPAPLNRGNYERAKMVPLTQAKRSPGFHKLEASNPLCKRFQKFLPELYQASDADQYLTFTFKGTAIGFYDLLGPDCGQLEVALDGDVPRLVRRFDSFSTYHRLGSFFAGKDLADEGHTVVVKISSKPLDKPQILAQRHETMNDPDRFKDANWYVSKIMIIGDPE